MRTVAMRLQEAVNGVCPILGVSIGQMGIAATVRITFDPAATPAQQTAGQNAVTAFDWSDTAHAAWELTKDRAEAATDFSDVAAPNKLLRAALLALLDEVNLIRGALVPVLPARTIVQVRTAVLNKLSSGAAD
jgi:hypothetical protein